MAGAFAASGSASIEPGFPGAGRHRLLLLLSPAAPAQGLCPILGAEWERRNVARCG
jgi:hypothetical protein